MTPPTTTASAVLPKHHPKALRLPTVARECEKIAVRCAGANVDHLGHLLRVCELEPIERERKAAERRLKAARFPAPKTLAEFDFAARPSVNKPLILDRLTHRCHIVELTGESYRLQDAKRRRTPT